MTLLSTACDLETVMKNFEVCTQLLKSLQVLKHNSYDQQCNGVGIGAIIEDIVVKATRYLQHCLQAQCEQANP